MAESKHPSETQVGRHVLAELRGCSANIIATADTVEQILITAVQRSGATYISHDVHQFSPHGVSAIVMVSESHFSIHTWPEIGYVAFDMFTCSDRIDVDAAIDTLARGFESDEVELQVLQRG